MQREDDHRLKALRNEEFAASLDRSDPTKENWAVVAIFYSALHYVQAYFSRYNVECPGHKERRKEINDDDRIKTVFESYQYLYVLSQNARYRCVKLPDEAYSKAHPHLEAVKKQIAHAMQLASVSPAKPILGSRTKAMPQDPPRPSPGQPKS